MPRWEDATAEPDDPSGSAQVSTADTQSGPEPVGPDGWCPARAAGRATYHWGMRIERRAGDVISAAQLAAVLRLRAAVFVVEQRIISNDLDPAIDCLATTMHYAVFAEDGEDGGDGEALAYLRTYPYEGARKIGRVVTAASVRGTGLGVALMEAVISHEPGLLVLSGQLSVEGFYERLGFMRVGDPYVEEGIDHVWMERTGH